MPEKQKQTPLPEKKKAQTPFPVAEPWDDKGKVLLEKGTRNSVGNDKNISIESRQHLMEMLNANLLHRHKEQLKNKKAPIKGTVRSRRDMLDELFG